MRKEKAAAAVLAAGMILASLTGCGKSPKPSRAEQKDEVKPAVLVDYSLGLTDDGMYRGIKALDYVTLPKVYMAIHAPLDEIAADNFYVSGFMDYLKLNAGEAVQVSDRAAQMGDNVTVSYVGRVDGVEFEGGTVDNHYATLGMGDLIEGFEEQVVGHKPGDKFTVKITFPEDYPSTTDENHQELELAGKECVFDVTLNGVENIVLEDDKIAEFFGDDTLFDGTKVDSVSKAQMYYAERQELENKQSFVEDYLIENSTVKELPDSVIGQQLKIEKQYAEKQAADYGYDTAEDFLKEHGYEDMDSYLEVCREDATEATKRALILQAVAEEQGIKALDTSYQAYFGGDPSMALDTYGRGYTAQLALDYEVLNTLQSHMIIEEPVLQESPDAASSVAVDMPPLR